MKKPTRKSLIRKLDILVSKIVRERDKSCVMCGSIKQLKAGHLFSRRYYNGRWNLDNVWTQCWPENFRHSNDSYPYWNWYITKFGFKKFQSLAQEVRQITHYKDFDLVELLEQIKSNENSSQ
mgnify:CR=1 FL=1